jgi:hypothetical protein
LKFLLSLIAATALLVLPSLAAPTSHGSVGHFSGPGFRGPGVAARPFSGSRFRRPIYAIGRTYYPFWGGFCSVPPWGAPFYSPWYYCFPGYDWDYSTPYYWDSYDGYNAPATPLGPNEGLDSSSSHNVCGNWIWRAGQSQYQWVTSPCAVPSARP